MGFGEQQKHFPQKRKAGEINFRVPLLCFAECFLDRQSVLSFNLKTTDIGSVVREAGGNFYESPRKFMAGDFRAYRS